MPSAGVTVTKSRCYGRFLDALEEYELVVSLHGTGSAEADLARAHVRVARDEAVKAWREGEAA